MEIRAKQGSLIEEPCDVLIVNLFEGVKEPGGGTGAVDKALGGAIVEEIQSMDFSGCFGDMRVIFSCDKIPAKKVLLVGLGKREDFSITSIMRASAVATRKCRSLKAKSVASILHGAGIGGFAAYDCARATALGAILGIYEYTRLKTTDVSKNTIGNFNIVEHSADKISNMEAGIQRAELIGDSIVYVRNLVNEPSNIVTPSHLAEQAQNISNEFGFECEIKDRKAIEDMGMGLLAAVARGASVEPRFITMKYTSPGAKKTIAIIGKGITFDTGGYSLKPADSMYGMKDDMAGAANVLGAMKAVGKCKLAVNVVALIPATENAIGAKAIHPGDVFKSLSGKTVEVNNTDAEGRLVLADAITYAKNLGVDEMVDSATLTGACVVALGRQMAGVFSNNQQIANQLIDNGKQCGEDLWQLPLYEEYKDELKSDVADLKNTGGRMGAAINGALFLESFVGDTPWAHIDLASSMIDKDIDLAKKGATGAGTGTLIEYLLKYLS